MRQASILGWLKEKKSKPKKMPKVAYFFQVDIPEIMLPDLKTAGPFRKNDLVSEGALPEEVWRVLLERGAVRPYCINLDYPAWKGG